MKTILESFRRYTESIKDEFELIDNEEEESDSSEELEEAGMCHNPDTGHFDDCDAGAIYSLSKKGADSAGIDSKHVGRGKVSSKSKDGIKYRSLYGANTSKDKSCGRIRFPSGDEGYKKYSCSNYSKKYSQTESSKKKRLKHPLVPSSEDSDSERLDKLGFDKHTRALAKGIIRADEVVESDNDFFISLNDLIKFLESIPQQQQKQIQMMENNKAIVAKCRKLGFQTQQEYFKNLTSSLSKIKQAMDGKLGVPQK